VSITIVEGWRGLSPADRGASVALGAFDGVHRGHEKVVSAARRHADGGLLGVISFEPHPFRRLNPTAAHFLLMNHGQQARAFATMGVQRLYLLPFDEEMMAMSDEAFARDVLADGLGVRHVAAGFDIRFGHDRAGDADALKRYGERFGFGVTIIERVDDGEGHKLSSTAVRSALQSGDPQAAAEILGHPFAIEGVVVPGRRMGRKLGFPTANVELDGYVRPKFGTYASRTRLPDGRMVAGVSYIGAGGAVEAVEPRLEVWLLDFDEDIYGQVIETQLIDFLRPDSGFESVEALVAQVNADADAAREVLAKLG
jgi:riboflavin kinase/FMN adenylyltransferase